MKRFILVIFISMFSLAGCQSKFVKKIYNYVLPEPEPITQDIRVALVLSGGGVRTVAQIGVIEVLKEHNIPIDLIVGTSGGSIIGALYADKADVENMKKIGLEFKKTQVIKLSLKDAFEGTTSLRGGIDGSLGERYIEQVVEAKEFKDLKIPLIAVATDLKTGKTVSLRSGKIAPSIRASCAIPGLFSPVALSGMMLVDGGVTSPLPVDVAKEYDPDLIIAVDVSTPVGPATIRNMFDVAHRSAIISYGALCEQNGRSADILIKPVLTDVGLFDDDKNHITYIAGKIAAEKQIPEIKKLLKKKQKKKSTHPE